LPLLFTLMRRVVFWPAATAALAVPRTTTFILVLFARDAIATTRPLITVSLAESVAMSVQVVASPPLQVTGIFAVVPLMIVFPRVAARGPLTVGGTVYVIDTDGTPVVSTPT